MDTSQNFAIYLVGFLVIVGGLAYGAFLAGVPPTWIVVGVICLIGLGILSAVKKTQPVTRTTRVETDRGESDRH
jgi:hypothetical protein